MIDSSATRRTFLQTGTALALTPAINVLGANDKIKLGLIGTGGRGQRLLRAITNIADFHVAACCDVVEERAQRGADICEQYKPAVRTYTHFQRMLDEEDLDACLVATEEANHAKCSIPVMMRDIHCFCEKPVDISVEAVERFTQAARQTKAVVQIGFQRHYVPTFQTCMNAIHNEDKLGNLTYLQGMWHWTDGLSRRYLDMDLSGGWFLAQACHHADVMMWAMNYQPPVSCAAMGAVTVDHENPPAHMAEDHSALVYQFPGNVTFSYTHVMHAPAAFTGEKLWAYGTKGGIDFPKGMFHAAGDDGESSRIADEVSDWDEGTYEALIGFAKHIKNNETPLCDIEKARLSTLMGIMGQRAMYNRRTKEYGLSQLTWDELMRS